MKKRMEELSPEELLKALVRPEYKKYTDADGCFLPRGNTSHEGCIGELIVTVDLMRRDYEIFRAISPGCGCDLIAVRGGSSLRVEVTKGHRTGQQLRYPRHDTSRYDILAVWERDGVITYIPTIDEPRSI